MSVTVANFQENMNYYISMAAKQDIFIVQDGKIIAKLTNPNQDRISAAKSLFGILPQSMSLEEVRKKLGE